MGESVCVCVRVNLCVFASVGTCVYVFVRAEPRVATVLQEPVLTMVVLPDAMDSKSRASPKAFMSLAAARKLAATGEILLWMTPSEAPKALQASECSELLDPTRASCWISAQH